MTSHPADPPLRQITRLRAEMNIASAQHVAGLFRDYTKEAVEYGIVARVCLPDWIRGDRIARPATVGRAIAIRRMAHSLGAPAESVRRHVHALIEQGIFVATADGVAVAPTPANEGLATAYYLFVHDLMVRFLEDVAQTCDLDLPVSGPPDYGVGDIIERGIDNLLMSIDTFRPDGRLPAIAVMLWTALTVVAVRDVTYDPDLSRRFAGTIPPDELRAAISLRRLAAALAIPYATAWRQIHFLMNHGLVTRVDHDNWTVLTGNLLVHTVRDMSTPPSLAALRKVRELARLGLDPARAGELYRVGRPPVADFGRPA